MIARVVASEIARAQTIVSNNYGVSYHKVESVIIGELHGKAGETG